MKNFTLFFLGCSIIWVAGCCLSGEEKVVHDLTAQDREWLIYEEGDTLRFTTIQGLARELYVKSIELDTLAQPDKFRSGCKAHYLTRATIGFAELPDNCPSCQAGSELILDRDESGLYAELYWLGLKGYSMQSQMTDTLTLGSQTFTQVFRAIASSQSSWGILREWSYDRTHGMLQFITSDSVIWRRVFN